MPSTRTLSAVVTLLVTVGAAGQEQARVPAAGTSLIAGRVVDVTSDQPIAGATVLLRSLNRITDDIDPRARAPRTPDSAVVTDSQGRFVFSQLLAGNYAVRPQRGGYTALGSAYVVLAADSRRIDVPARMGRRGSIAGTVRDDVGDPVVEMIVMVFLRRSLGGASPLLVERGSTKTDDRGRYRVGNLQIGDYFVCVCGSEVPLVDAAFLTTITPPGLTTELLASRADRTIKTFAPTFYPGRTKASEATVVTVDFSDDRSGIDIGLTAVSPHRVSGHIVNGADAQGTWRLSLVGKGDLPEAQFLSEHNTTPDADGRFEFANVPSGDYTLGAADKDRGRDEPWVWASQPVSVSDQDVAGVEVTLRTGVTVSGRVEYAGGALRPTAEELASARVSLFPIDLTPAVMAPVGATGKVGYGAEIEADGSFRITGIVPGRYLARGGTVAPAWQSIGSISASGTPLSDTFVTVGESDLSGVLITVVDTPMASIEGRVTLRLYDGPQEFFACLFPTDRALWTETFRAPDRFVCQAVSANSTYSLATVPPGEYFVALRHRWLTDWIAPRQLEALARTGTRVTARAGENATANLKR